MAVSRSKPRPADAPAPHLVPLAPGWTLWRWICLRGTGFPVSLLERFGAPEAARAADSWDAAEAAARDAKYAAAEFCIRHRMHAQGDARTAWNRASRRLLQGQRPDMPDALAALAPFAESVERAGAAMAAARTRFETLVPAAVARERRAVAEIAGDPRFQQALVWQNRRALHDNLVAVARAPAAPINARRRKHERQALRYIQRYASRNESIGFFGPVGWGDFTGGEPVFELRPGPALVSARVVEFEGWTIRLLAARLAQNARMLPWLAPRRNPVLRFAADAVLDASGRRHALPPEIAKLAAACDGRTPARDIANRLAAVPGSGFADARAVLAALADLARRRVLHWDLPLPIGFNPELHLKERLERIGDEKLRRAALAPLEELIAARDRVAAAAGDVDALDTAMAGLETVFARLSGATRKGAGLVGRGIAYEDCRRGVTLRVGAPVVARLGPPLALVLASARWFTDGVALRAMTALDALFDAVAAKAKTDTLDFAVLWKKQAETGVFSDANLAPVVPELQTRWAKILPLDSPERRVALDIRELAPLVAESFPARDLPFPRPIHHAPDVMIAAESADAVARGDYRFVLGETHAAYPNIQQPMVLRLHPDTDAVLAGWNHDMAGRACFFPTLPNPERRVRYPLSAQACELVINEGAPSRPPERVFAVADFVVRRTESGLRVESRDGRHSFHIMEVFGYRLSAWAPGAFKMFGTYAHTPRITVDNFVLARESWAFPAGDGGFAREKTEARRFHGARAWARAHGLPRRVFMRFPQEDKPIYADLESPAFVDLLAQFWRAAVRGGGDGRVTVSEMLPDLHETWLVDAEGNRYTSELRLNAVEAPGGTA